VAKICHDSKAVIRSFAALDVEVKGSSDDTMLAAFLLDPTQDAEAAEAGSRSGLGGVLVPARTTIAGKGKHTLEPVSRSSARPPWAGAIAHAMLGIRRHSCRSASRPAGLKDSLPHDRAADRASCSPTSGAAASTSIARTSRSSASRCRQARRPRGPHLQARRRRIQHRVAQAARRAAVRQARAADQGRCAARRPAGSTEADSSRRSITDHPTHHGSPRAVQAQGHVPRRAAAARVGEDRAAPHNVQPGRGRDRSDLVAGSEPPEHPIRSELGMKIRRGFIAAPKHVLIAAGLLADRAAHPRAPVGRSADERRVPRIGSTSTPRPRAEVFRRAARRGHQGAAPDREGRQLRPVVRPVRLRARAHARESRARRPPSTRAATSSGSRPSTSSWTRSSRCGGPQGGARTLLGRWRPIANLMSKSPARASRGRARCAKTRRCRARERTSSSSRCSAPPSGIVKEQWPIQMLLTVHDELVFEAPHTFPKRSARRSRKRLENV